MKLQNETEKPHELDVKKSEPHSNEDLKIKVLRVKTNLKAGPFFARCN